MMRLMVLPILNACQFGKFPSNVTTAGIPLSTDIRSSYPYFSIPSEGEPFHFAEGRANDLLFMHPHSPGLPLDVLNVQLPPEEESQAIAFGRQLSEMSDEFESDHTNACRSRSNSTDERKIVQFKKHIIHVPTTCALVQIPIIRTRAADRVVNARWRTCDKSAKAGLHYVKSEGSISLAQDEEEKTIEIAIIRNLDRSDIHFAVELFDAEGTFNTLVIYIRDDSNLYPEEKQIVQNIFNCGHRISVSEIVTRLSDKVTPNTFKAALLCLSSCADSMPTKELALGAELLNQTTPYASLRTLTSVFCDFFSYLPELEDLV
ncbi:unnamed protein product [Larinioides sclopetarius]|uniref:Calx-beta domain-containing protein n=1 Tax=Larinioides sclopetarius TaxID=280406 RepID=A0AAV2BU66_9ARAC